ncbi:hypothetical protein Bca4012_047721 [Brassica carinata]
MSWLSRWRIGYFEISVIGSVSSTVQTPTIFTYSVSLVMSTPSVTLEATLTCTCPDRKKPCKHILFVLIRVLGIPLDDDKCLRQRRLRPCLLYPQFLQLLSTANSNYGDASSSSSTHELENEMEEEAATCPICLDDIQVIQNVNGECVGGEEGERSVVKCMVNQQEQSA